MASVTEQPVGTGVPHAGAVPWTVAQWVLAGLAAPGGAPMTSELVRALSVTAGDRVVQLGPGLGGARAAALAARPRLYVAVDPDPGAAARLGPRRPRLVPKILRNAVPDDPGTPPRVRTTPLDAIGLDDGDASVVIAEGSLGTLPDPPARSALREAARLLRTGGRLGLHELALAPGLGEEEAARVAEELALPDGSGLHARSVEGWRALVEEAGLIVLGTTAGPVATSSPRDLARAVGPRHLVAAVAGLAREPGRRRSALDARVAVDRHLTALRALVLLAEKPLVLGMRRPRTTGAVR